MAPHTPPLPLLHPSTHVKYYTQTGIYCKANDACGSAKLTVYGGTVDVYCDAAFADHTCNNMAPIASPTPLS